MLFKRAAYQRAPGDIGDHIAPVSHLDNLTLFRWRSERHGPCSSYVGSVSSTRPDPVECSCSCLLPERFDHTEAHILTSRREQMGAPADVRFSCACPPATPWPSLATRPYGGPSHECADDRPPGQRRRR